jgi:hypothetical protein
MIRVLQSALFRLAKLAYTPLSVRPNDMFPCLKIIYVFFARNGLLIRRFLLLSDNHR